MPCLQLPRQGGLLLLPVLVYLALLCQLAVLCLERGLLGRATSAYATFQDFSFGRVGGGLMIQVFRPLLLTEFPRMGLTKLAFKARVKGAVVARALSARAVRLSARPGAPPSSLRAAPCSPRFNGARRGLKSHLKPRSATAWAAPCPRWFESRVLQRAT